MSLRDVVSAILGRTVSEESAHSDGFQITADSDGLLALTSPSESDSLARGQGSPLSTAQMIMFRMLVEQGLATESAGGFFVPSEHVAALDGEASELLQLPDRLSSQIKTKITGHTGSNRFEVTAFTEVDGREARLELRGPLIRADGTEFLATVPQLRALTAIAEHSRRAPQERTDTENAALVATLQVAQEDGADIDLAHFSRGGWTTTVPEKVGIVATQTQDGGLRLAPRLPGVDDAQTQGRWGQLRGRTSGVMRVGKNLIVLDDKPLAAVREVLANRDIAPHDVQTFLKTPSAFLDAELIDLDLGFSVRVEGIGRLQHLDFSEAAATNLDWFAADGIPALPSILIDLLKTTDDVSRFEAQYEAAATQGATEMRFDAELIDIADPHAVAEAVGQANDAITNPTSAPPAEPSVPDRDEPSEKVGFLLHDADQVVAQLTERASRATVPQPPDYATLKRAPFPHQRAGIEWMTALMASAHKEERDELYRLQGALLADDMGLGKTFMTLVAVREYMRLVARSGNAPKPTLVVAPLSLLENWEDEVAKTFNESPFDDVVVLQSSRDLNEYRVRGAGRETSQMESLIDDEGRIDKSQIRISLRVGRESGPKRLDKPRRLVITTYDTLRDYQFSLSQIDWGITIFDEAQNLKNPTAMRTLAAKALKAEFKLLATGTPVENALGEFWCLIDTAQPGLLGSWAEFRTKYILPTQGAVHAEAEQLRVDLGRDLRATVGPFMLRREKEDHVEGLPRKTIHTPFEPTSAAHAHDATLARPMPPSQRAVYEGHVQSLKGTSSAESSSALKVLLALRLSSLHPDLSAHGVRPSIPTSASQGRDQWQESAKLTVLMAVLEDIRTRGEKVIVFAMSKDLQLLLAMWIQMEWGVTPHIINGDTAASSNASGTSRRQLIQQFENEEGFGVIIMSPIAAGVGLTVVGANHVVHLERHWNPAKEAQATDRVYRIGQTKDVHVYLPAATHPSIDSFDVLLDRLLGSKIQVRDTVMAPGVVSENEFLAALNGSTTS